MRERGVCAAGTGLPSKLPKRRWIPSHKKPASRRVQSVRSPAEHWRCDADQHTALTHRALDHPVIPEGVKSRRARGVLDLRKIRSLAKGWNPHRGPQAPQRAVFPWLGSGQVRMGRLSLKVVPGSSRDAVAGRLGDSLKVKMKAPPEFVRNHDGCNTLQASADNLAAIDIRSL